MFLLLPSFVPEYVHEIVVTTIIAVLGAVLMFPFKYLRKEWNAAKDTLLAVQAELAVQRTNCLTTLQEDGKAQIKLLEKLVQGQETAHIATAEQTGYLKAMASRS